MVNKSPTPGPAVRRRDPDATRAALLAAGAGLFAERGYDGVPVAVIADKARVNKAMINYHFGGKRGLYRAIVRATFSEIVARAERLADSARPAPELLSDLVELIADTAKTRQPHFPAMMLREVLAGGRHLDAEIIAYPLRIADVVRRIIARGVREGSFRAVDPLATHLSLVGSLLFFFATAPLRARMQAHGQLPVKGPEPGAYVKHIQEVMIHGLAASTAIGRRDRRHRRGHTG